MKLKSFWQMSTIALVPDQWQITCIRFAPNAPEQNPVEDVWLQAKNFPLKDLDRVQIFFCCQVKASFGGKHPPKRCRAV